MVTRLDRLARSVADLMRIIDSLERTVGLPGEARAVLEEAVANCRDLGDPVREAVARHAAPVRLRADPRFL